MDEYLIYENRNLIDSDSPVMHAIIIGIGAYPNAGDILDDLSSPSHSAREIATWLLDCNLGSEQPYPLASLSLLISEDSPKEFKHISIPQPVIPKQPNSNNVKDAVSKWIRRADSNVQDLTFFYFCGHGVSNGISSQSLLLADYNSDKYNPMDGAIDFKGFVRGMRRCAASRQLYFIDACRNTAEIATDTESKGHPLIAANINRQHDGFVEPAIFYATVEGGMAYGKRNSISYFTEALINCLRGIGSHDRGADDKWRVSTGLLNQAIQYFLNTMHSTHDLLIQAQFSEFDFHVLKDEPDVLILMSCNDGEDNYRAIMECYREGNLLEQRTHPLPEIWQIYKKPGQYDFLAKVDMSTGKKQAILITPPYKCVNVEVLL
ncbi:caspase family protein [Alteromonas sp. KUL106]|uniref:caspase family protein n=1 Tax=Alteromonas sp. KUL106 TaxID=2480799 RepID=UPI0012E4C43E|nr:caspase family protein [Alteromonas sp. KUL106]GFD70369.1 hypothetical protein KUL106_36320 [Alteromonas sp. KUL106]